MPAGFSLVEGLSSSIASGGIDTFTVRLDTNVAGSKSGQVSFATNDGDENPFNFSIAGTVTSAGAPEIVVRGNGSEIADNDSTPSTGDHTDFGSVALAGAATTRTFTVTNSGNATLTTSSLSLPVGFTLAEGLSASIAAGSSDTFTVRLDTNTAGVKSGQISFTTNDSDENPFNFSVTGIVVAASGDFARHDFNGDDRSDILWRHDDGTLAIWQMNGFQVADTRALGQIAGPWKILDTDDFNSDDRSDILWRHDDGTLAIWQMNGFQVADSRSLGQVSSQWKILETADFNGDGRSDILWRHDDGTLAIWRMNGFQVADSRSLGQVSSQWKIVETADFNGDRRSDILWRHDDGTLAIWQMDGFQVTASQGLGKVSSQWKILETADFNGDDRSDILWRHDDGTLAIWQMDGFQVAASQSLGKVSSQWKILDTGDFDGDDQSDILWRNDDGTLAIWDMSGFQVAASQSLGNIANQWHVIA